MNDQELRNHVHNIVSFLPIEKTSPGWTGARMVVDSFIPRKQSIYGTVPTDRTKLPTLMFDWAWFEGLLTTVSIEAYLTDLKFRCLLMEPVVTSILLEGVGIAGLAGRPMSDNLVTEANLMLIQFDQLSAEKKLPTITDVQRHFLGVQPMQNPVYTKPGFMQQFLTGTGLASS